MAQLTTEQLNLIGQEILSAAQTIGDYRYENYAALSDTDKQKLDELHETLLGYCDQLAFTTAMANIDDAQAALGQIKQITAAINKNITTLTKVQTVINIAGAVVALAATIATGGATAGAIATDIAAALGTVEAIKGT
jgi:hypothetical protein